MKFRKYQHIQRLGDGNVHGIENGICYVFPKIDGGNHQTWLGDDNEIHFGKRTNEITVDHDCNGFASFASKQENIKAFHNKYPNLRLYGEWLTPHVFKNYRDEAWNRFYIFDVTEEINEEKFRYLSYEEYKLLLDEFGLDYITPIIKIENPTPNKFVKYLEKNRFLLTNDAKMGEGVVIKNYNFVNKSGNTIWAKIVSNEFLEDFQKAHPCNESFLLPLENRIIENYLTNSFIEKEICKFIEMKDGGWQKKYISELFKYITDTMIQEEIINIIYKEHRPMINFALLYKLSLEKIKNKLKEKNML